MIEAIAGISNLLGKGLDSLISYKNAKRNIKYQREFAQHGIRWKVEDAKAAGLHPLAALGANTVSFSPVSVGSNFGEMGQDIARAANALNPEDKKTANVNDAVMDKLKIENAALQNQYLASQIAKMNQAGNPPSAPSLENRMLLDGQGNSGAVQTKPHERQASSPTNPGAEAGAMPDTGWTKNADGSYSLIPSKDFQDRGEDNKIAQFQWFVRNQLVPPKELVPYPPPPGKAWTMNPITGRFWLYDTAPSRQGVDWRNYRR